MRVEGGLDKGVIGGDVSFYKVEKRLNSKMVKMKEKAIPILITVLIGICILAPMVSAEPAEYWNEMGIGFAISGEYEKAIECFNMAIVMRPNNAEAYFNRGTTHARLNRYEKAIEDFNKAIELDQGCDKAYCNRGGAYAALSQYERAIEDFNKAIELYPYDGETYYNRGLAYYGLKQYEKAIEDFDKAVSLDPTNVDADHNREVVISKLEEKNSTPGFEAISTITGLLAMTYLSRRRRG
jgi:tetratricopeptide (TPR) repeat protein